MILAAIAVLLVVAALAPGAVASARSGRRGAAVGWAAALVASAGAIVAAAALAAPQRREADVTERPIADPADGYVGAAACLPCHPSEHRSWHASYHRTMTQVATPASVLAPLGPVSPGEPLALARRGDELVVGRGEPGDRALVLVTGSHHMQSYWLASGAGRSLTAFPWAWLRDDRRWISRASLFVQPPELARADSPEGAWNQGCARCHTTQPRGSAAVGEPADTKVVDFGIACEACHGPGAEHVSANSDPLRRWRLHRGGARDPTITLPTRLPPRRQADVCGQCHSVWVFASDAEAAGYHARGSSYRPGAELAVSKTVLRRGELANTPAIAQTIVQQPDFADRYWWRDGMVRVTGREYNGLIESPCYQRGEMTCSSCHALHRPDDDPRPLAAWADDQLRAGDGDVPCLACHTALRDRVAEHTHHAAGSSGNRCLSCHMPYTTWGLLGASRSHTVSSPSVKESLDTGRPNACNQCHLDRTLAWMADRLAAWYGQPSPSLSDDQRTVAASIVWSLSGDAGQRALMAWSFGWDEARAASGDDWMPAFLTLLLDDEYDAVRVAAGRTLAKLPAGRDVAYDFAAPHPAREAAQRAYMERVPRPPPIGRAELLRSPDGQLDRAHVQRLLEWRDRRPVALWE